MDLAATDDTIVAIATPPGRGGIGVLRVSGPEARAIAEPILRLAAPLAAGRARFGDLLDPSGLPSPSPTGPAAKPRVLDQVVATYFAAPHSYTADDVVEISMHGSPVLLETVLQYTLRGGARLARPGEFTERAFRAGRLDLTAAEAVRDLIEASTLAQARTAAAQLGGAVSRAVAPAKRDLVTLVAALEAGIDFAEDDVETMDAARILDAIDRAAAPLRALTETFAYGRIVREGITVALAGRPNAGKSSLFNRLLGRDRAIVTAQPGTTRDLLSERFSIGAIPVDLVDTAGLRELAAEDVHEAERAGIERTRSTVAEAHHVLLLIDAAALDRRQPALQPEDQATLASLDGRPATVVFNKIDLLSIAEQNSLQASFPEAVLVSSLTGAGLEALRRRLEAKIAAERPSDDTTLVTSLRQQAAIDQALASLRSAAAGAAGRVPHEILLLDLHGALSSLDQLTGSTSPDAILQEIFSTFCIGK